MYLDIGGNKEESVVDSLLFASLWNIRNVKTISRSNETKRNGGTIEIL